MSCLIISKRKKIEHILELVQAFHAIAIKPTHQNSTGEAILNDILWFISMWLTYFILNLLCVFGASMKLEIPEHFRG